MPRPTDRTYAEISLSALRKNILLYKQACGKKILLVCKAFSYGHGMIAPFLERYVDGFVVATAEEGIALREAGVEKLILVLGYIPLEKLSEVVKNRLTVTAFDLPTLHTLSERLQAENATIEAHIAVNTGMNRVGLFAEEIPMLNALKNIYFTGIYSHYAVKRTDDETFFQTQTERFLTALSVAKSESFPLSFIHIANSANAPFSPVGNAVRLGYGAYGYGLNGVTPALSWYARVVQTRFPTDGETVGYDRTFRVLGQRKIATLAVGYGDGYPRSLSNAGYVLYKGKKLPVVGRVCMDMLTVDGTGSDLTTGDYALLLGADLPANELSFGYETLARISQRVPRYYID